MRLSRIISCAVALVIASATVAAGPPQRVVSLNVCTDQLLLMLAEPEQIAALSALSHDPRSSVFAQAAGNYPITNGTAEEVVLYGPDLVLAGTFTTRATVAMLEGLGYRVELFAPINSFDDARANIRRVGVLLGREARAEEVVHSLDAALAALRETPAKRPRAALFFALGGTTGRDTMPGEILETAGMDNIATELGVTSFGGALSLEELVMSNPDLILVGSPYSAPARATDLLAHPALKHTGALRVIQNGVDWVCETPALAKAVAAMVELRHEWEAAR